MGELRVLTSYGMEELVSRVPKSMRRAGDTKVIFDPEVEEEVDVAKEQFENLIDKGFTAFKVNKKGEKSTTKFNPKEGKYIFLPPIQGG